MDEHTDIDGKIVRVLNGTASEEEKQAVSNWTRLSKGNAFQFQKLKAVWKAPLEDPQLIGHEEQKQKIWKAYASEGHSSKYKYIPGIPFYSGAWVKIAAVFAIIFFPLYVFYFQQAEIPEEKIPVMRMISKSNPTGQKSMIQLPDGTKIWLNSDSRISYNEGFSDSLRSIHLEGEAYFDVVKDSLRPFVVDFESLSVTVLGTEFNISAFKADNDLRVTLVDGSVSVSNTAQHDNLILKPGAGLIYSKEKNDYHEFTKNSNPELFYKTTEWRHGKLIFDGRNFQDFVMQIKRWYGVKVQVVGSPPSGWNIRASFENEPLINVMDAVSYNKEFRYTLKDKELIIMFN